MTMKHCIAFRNTRFSAVTCAALLGITLIYPLTAQSAGTVGTGTPESCTEAALDAALAGGGSVKFDCGPTPHTIVVTSTKVISVDTQIDGGNLISLSGGDLTSVLNLYTDGIRFVLQNIEITKGSSERWAGGLYNVGGNISIINCRFTYNKALYGGGAIYNRGYGTVFVNHTTFENNTLLWNEQFGSLEFEDGQGGAAIKTWAGDTTILNSAFKNNTALYGTVQHNEGNLIIGNSTFTNNSGYSKNKTGVISMWGPYTTATIKNSTISNNQTTALMSANISISNSLITNNTGGNCSGTILDGGHNLQYPGTDCGTTIPVADPLLASLADNGGVTRTLALLPGSPAIDAGDPAACPAFDQRGMPRVDGDGAGGVVCDIGAFEFTQAFLPTLDYSAVWWNPDEAGLSFTFHQNASGIAFATWYTYDIDHKDMWLNLQGRWVAPNVFAGTLYRTSGPAIGESVDRALVTLTPVGSGSIRFSDADNAQFSYSVNGVAATKAIKRFVF